MLFVIDIGNSNTVLGLFKGQSLIHEWRIQTDRYKTEDEFGMLIQSLFDYDKVKFSDVEGIIISSVVPQIMRSMELLCEKYFAIDPVIVGKDGITNYIKVDYPYPKEIGADRIVNAVGAIAMYDGPIIIIDFGTATTFCYIDEGNAYQGGIIAPGIKISVDALYDKAAKLPKIEIEEPATVVGKSTINAMKSGVYFGYTAQVDGIVRKMIKETQSKPVVIATGGLAPLIAPGSEMIEYVEINLTLFGLHEIYYKMCEEKSDI